MLSMETCFKIFLPLFVSTAGRGGEGRGGGTALIGFYTKHERNGILKP